MNKLDGEYFYNPVQFNTSNLVIIDKEITNLPDHWLEYIINRIYFIINVFLYQFFTNPQLKNSKIV